MRRGKYNNHSTWIGDLRFDSKAEALRWTELKLLEAAGQIVNLRRQVAYPLYVNKKLICTYKADFVYDIVGGRHVVEDVKGHQTQVFKLKSKLFAAVRGQEIELVLDRSRSPRLVRATRPPSGEPRAATDHGGGDQGDSGCGADRRPDPEPAQNDQKPC